MWCVKRCPRCCQVKPLDAFSRDSAKKGGLRTACRDCLSAQRRAKRAAVPKTTRPPLAVRTCRSCGETKPVEAFSRSLASKRHPWSRCRDCQNAARRAQRAADPTKRHPERWHPDPSTGLPVKRCPRCGATLPEAAYGWRNKAKGERHAICKVCARAERQAAYWRDPARFRRRALEYAQANPEKVRARTQRWIAANRDAREAKRRAYLASHRRERLAAYRRYNEIHRAERLAYDRSRPPEMKAEAQARRRARKQQAPVVEWIWRSRIIERDGSRCYLCGDILTAREIVLEHVVPLKRGGHHTHDNLRVACVLCNARKGSKLLSELDPADFPLLAVGG